VWTPDQDVLERANVVRLMRRHGIESYWELVRRSQDDPEWFWPAVIDDLGLEFERPWERVLDLSDGPEWAKWFVGGTLNIAWNCVHRWAASGRRDDVAAVFAGEDGSRREMTFGELSEAVTRFAEVLVSIGVGQGDVVALFLPMSPQVAIASHACAHIGAIQLPIFSGFAAPAVATRLQDSGAKVVVTADGSLRRGREHPMKDIVDDALLESPSVERVIVWPRLGRDVPIESGRDLFWDEALERCPGSLDPVPLDAETPYLLTYTSGTTGRPKGVVHVQGGFLVSIAREVAYQADGHPDDVLHFATDMGWIMGPWTVDGGGAVCCRIV
jgi:acetyl-CoA synthetase